MSRLSTRRRFFQAERSPSAAALALLGRQISVDGTTPFVERYTATHYVTASAAGGGDGSLLSPWTASEAVVNAVAGNVVKWGAGVYEVVAGGPQQRDPSLVFTNNGTSANRIIHFAETPAILATSDAQKTIIRASSGIGSIVGTGPTTNSGGDYTTLDGMQVEIGGTYDSSDTASMVVNWDCVGQKILRCIIDQGNHVTSFAQRNWGAYFAQRASNFEIADCIIRNGNISGATNNASVMLYECDTYEIHHNTFDSVNIPFFPKGAPGSQKNLPGSFHHNLIKNCDRFVTIGEVGETFTAGQWLDIYSNVAYGLAQIIARMTAYVLDSPRRIRFVNNTIYDATNPVVGNGAVIPMSAPLNAGSFTDIEFHNNIFHSVTADSYFYGSSSAGITVVDRMVFADNIYYGTPANIVSGVNFASWQGTYGNDTGGSYGVDPQLVNPAGADFRLGAASPAIGSGIDVLNLLGGGTSAAINCGAYITADMSDEIGVRLS